MTKPKRMTPARVEDFARYIEYIESLPPPDISLSKSWHPDAALLATGRARGGRHGADAERAAKVTVTLPVAPWEKREQEAEG